jgi:transcription termination factor Rho
MDRSLLEKKALAELREIASTLELKSYQRMKKADLVDLIIEAGQARNADASSNGGTESAASAGSTSDGSTGSSSSGSGRDSGASSETGVSSDGGTGTSGNGRGDSGDRSGGSTRVRARRRSEGDSSDRSDGASDRSDGDSGDRSQRTEDASDRSGSGRGDDASRGGGGRAPDAESSADGDDQDGRNRNKRERRRKGRGGQGGGQGQGQNQGGGQQDDLDDAEVREGVLDLLPEGYGFLRVTGYLSGDRDVYVSQSFVRRFDLRRGDRVAGPIRRNKNNDKFPALARVDTIEGEPLDGNAQRSRRPSFKDLTPLFPTERLKLELDGDTPMSMRLVDMFAPIGKGQRGLLVSPPKAGKTTVLKQLAHSIQANSPDVHVMVLLVDERPEEVTDFQRSTSGEVISSTFDRPAEDHTQVAELCIERAKRLVESGKDVVVLLDSITRLARAYNLAAPTSGKILSGGVDSTALYPPKRFFGAARNIEEGGSLTIIASALIDTGSKMDEVIFEEFKGTGNMELRLDRRMEQKRIFPALDIQASGTRREDLLLPEDQIATIWKLRRLLATMDAEAALQLLIDKLKATKSNEQFLQMIAKSNLQ